MAEAASQQVGAALVWQPPSPSPSHLWLRGSSGEIGFLQYFPEFLLKVGFLHKNETP
jgi:hypothetical protein